MYINRIKDWFEEKQWELYLFIAIIVIAGISIYNFLLRKEGTWSKQFNFEKIYKGKYENNIIDEQQKCESKGEYIVRQYLCKRFNKPFIKVRNIYNPVTHQNLELDCYNEYLGLAVEYQGRQHYKYTPYFHKNIETFRNQQYRDELKRIYCKQLNITLIEIPYYIKFEDIHVYLENQLQLYGY